MDRKVILRDLSRYWDELRGAGLAPRRSDLNPARFNNALEHMFILEVTAVGPLRIRLAGTRICDMLGIEPRGMPARAIFAPQDQHRADDLLSEVVLHPARIDLHLTGIGKDGTQYEGNMILRPLTDDFGDLTRVLGCMVIDTPRFETGVTIHIGAVKIDTLRDSSPHRRHIPAQPLAGFAEEQAPFDGPHLRSVDGIGRTRGEPRQSLSRDHLRVVSSKD